MRKWNFFAFLLLTSLSIAAIAAPPIDLQGRDERAPVIMKEVATPTAPAGGSHKIYEKSDGRMYLLDSSSVETQLTVNSLSQTLTNKVLTGNTAVNLISGSGTLVLPTSGTITAPSGTDTLAGLTLSQTLTNKTLTSPTINTPSLTGAMIDFEEYTDQTTPSTPAAGKHRLFFNSGTGKLSYVDSSGSVTALASGGGGSFDEPRVLQNLGISTSVSSNALTISLKQSDGSTSATALAPVNISFRNPTVTTGGYSVNSTTGSLSLVVSSGSTLGTLNATASTLLIYGINNAGTTELAIYNGSALDEGLVYSTTAEGGAGAADSAGVLYSTTARSNVAVRLLASITITETTAGTWATNASNISLSPVPSQLPASQSVFASYYIASGTQTPTTTTPINFSTMEYDDHSAVTTGSGWKFTAPYPGTYTITGILNLGSCGAGGGYTLYKNGSAFKLIGSVLNNTAVNPVLSGSIHLAATDYFDIRVNGGNTCSISGGAAGTYQASTISITRTGN